MAPSIHRKSIDAVLRDTNLASVQKSQEKRFASR
jgi:hypothetical protein